MKSKEDMKQHWQQLSPKEQRTVMVGAIALACILFLRFIWWPMYSNISTLQQDIQNETQLVEWMQPRVARIESASESGKTTVNKSLTTLENILSPLKPFVQSFSINANQYVNIQFKAVPMPSFIQWLETQTSQGWQTEQVQITPAGESGTADVTLSLS